MVKRDNRYIIKFSTKGLYIVDKSTDLDLSTIQVYITRKYKNCIKVTIHYARCNMRGFVCTEMYPHKDD